MHKLLKIQQFLANIVNTLVSILRVILRSKFNSALNNMKEVQDEILVLGNGPSLRESLDKYPKFVENKKKICVNLFVLSPEFELLRPDYYVVVDIGFFIGNTIPRVKEATIKMIKAFKDKTNWDITLLLPLEAKGSKFHKELSSSGSYFKFIFFNRTNIMGLKSIRHFLYNKNLGMPPPQNVLIAAIMLALNMRYKNIFIIGADHSWHESLVLKEGNKMEIEDSHFYDRNENRKLTIQDAESQKEYKLHELFAIWARAFGSYWYIKDYADSIKAKIFNASEKTYIDAFDRIVPKK